MTEIQKPGRLESLKKRRELEDVDCLKQPENMLKSHTLDVHIFSLYDIPIPVNLAHGQLDAWVSEAEQSYDPETLKKRGRGRPGRGADPAQVVAVRLTADELSAIDRLASEKHLTRSELIRQAISALTGA